MTSSSPTVRRWELARRLRELRLAAELTIDQAADELMCSSAKISRMETAGRGVSARDVRDLCRLYGTSDDLREELIKLAQDARRPGWWQNFGTLDDMVATFLGLETAAGTVRLFEGLRMPGLLQQSSYTQALLSALRPPVQLSSTWVQDQVKIRVRRQERLASGELFLHAIVDEAVLRRPVGGPEVMAAQVARLLQDATRPNITIQVIPFARGAHPGVDGAFQIMSFPVSQIGDVVFVEGLLGNFLLDKEPDVDRYGQVFDDLAHVHALGVPDTLLWLEALAKEMSSTPRRETRRGQTG